MYRLQMLSRFLLPALVAGLVACSEPVDKPGPEPLAEVAVSPDPETEQTTLMQNPLLTESTLYLGFPPFDRIELQHYQPAFERGMAEEALEVAAIATQAAAPSFANTIVALESSGQLLTRVSSVFFNLTRAHTSDGLQALQQQMAPRLAAHTDSIVLNRDLFARIQALYAQRASLALDAESLRLLEQYYQDFIRAGAALSESQQQQLREINAQLAVLQTQFNQNVLNEVNALAIVVDSLEELRGLDAATIASAKDTAAALNLGGNYVIPLLNYSDQPVLANLQDRSLRERIYRTSLSRGSRGGAFDNRETLARVLRLRAERAQLLGFENYAAYHLDNQTAGSVAAVNERLTELTPPAVANARREARELQQIIDAEGGGFELAAWDWAFYREKLRRARYAFDENQLRPYLELNNVLQRGVFFAAERLYGITFQERRDLPVYEDSVRVFEVFDSVGTTLALFVTDFYARPSKRGGGWTNSYVQQSDLLGTQPIVAINVNIQKPPAGEATLLTFDETTTLFHEFGHALHAMFSAVTYPYFSGTRVPRDFVEFPSQVNEMWATWPEVLNNYAVHYQTGLPLSPTLVAAFLEMEQFNQGFATTEYLAASILDQGLHQLSANEVPDADHILAFEHEVLSAAGIALDIIAPRYRSTYFQHIMGGYAAAYYSYIWAEVLDADSVAWFAENGGLLRTNGDHFRQTVLSRGGSEEALTLFRNFRGRDAEIAPLLQRRGLQ